MAVTHSTKEAMELLRHTRAVYIKAARKVADELIRLKGATHIREVFEVALERGVIDNDIPSFWLGAVFRGKKYRKLMDRPWFLPAVPQGNKNTHAWHPVPWWAFA